MKTKFCVGDKVQLKEPLEASNGSSYAGNPVKLSIQDKSVELDI